MNQETSNAGDKANTQATENQVFSLQRIYVKDISFEAPQSPNVFKEEWKPEVNIDLQSKTNELEKDVYDVVLHITATVKMGEKTAFVVEVHQGGIFTIQNLKKEQLAHALGAMCPNILYPYAREAISDLVTRGGFPQLLLAPVNFDALYLRHLQDMKNKQQGEGQAASNQTAN